MFVRCYSEQYLRKKPRYRGCTVDPAFHDFKDFFKWMPSAKGHDMSGWHIDKDIVAAGNKVYSPETCVFVPREINSFYTKREKSRGDYPLGVSLHKQVNRFMVSGHELAGKTIYLGLYDTPEEGFNVFLDHKKRQAKMLANIYDGLVDERVIHSLMNFTLSMED